MMDVLKNHHHELITLANKTRLSAIPTEQGQTTDLLFPLGALSVDVEHMYPVESVES